MQHRYIRINPDQSLSIAAETLPPLKADEVLVKAHGIGINRGDLLQCKGLYPPPKDASPIMGLEVSGGIIDLGSNVQSGQAGSWKIGDKVCALTHWAPPKPSTIKHRISNRNCAHCNPQESM